MSTSTPARVVVQSRNGLVNPNINNHENSSTAEIYLFIYLFISIAITFLVMGIVFGICASKIYIDHYFTPSCP